MKILRVLTSFALAALLLTQGCDDRDSPSEPVDPGPVQLDATGTFDGELSEWLCGYTWGGTVAIELSQQGSVVSGVAKPEHGGDAPLTGTMTMSDETGSHFGGSPTGITCDEGVGWISLYTGTMTFSGDGRLETFVLHLEGRCCGSNFNRATFRRRS